MAIGWLVSNYEQPMVFFIQRHWKIVLQDHWPARNRARLAVNYYNRFQVRKVHLNVRAGGFQLERFRMRTQFVFLGQTFARRAIHHANRSRFVLAVANIFALICRVVAQAVDVAVKINVLDERESGAVVDIELAFAAGGEELFRFRRISNSLRIGNDRDAVAAYAR